MPNKQRYYREDKDARSGKSQFAGRPQSETGDKRYRLMLDLMTDST